ncbi:MAG: hypothetical protein AB6733_24475 [Clostridiaceae bacterium]
MKYFILKEDNNLQNLIELEGFNHSEKMTLLKSDQDKFKDSVNILVKGNENSIYPELLQAPVLLVSENLSKIFQWHENTVVYKIAVFTDLKRESQKIYKLVLPELIDALSDKTTYLKNGWADKIVLDSNKIGEYNIFLIKAALDYHFVVSLDVVESILKRDFTGIKFQEVEVI